MVITVDVLLVAKYYKARRRYSVLYWKNMGVE